MPGAARCVIGTPSVHGIGHPAHHEGRTRAVREATIGDGRHAVRDVVPAGKADARGHVTTLPSAAPDQTATLDDLADVVDAVEVGDLLPGGRVHDEEVTELSGREGPDLVSEAHAAGGVSRYA